MIASKEIIINILKKNSVRLKSEYNVKSLYLFGSVSRGEIANDVDILFEATENFTLYTKIDLHEALEKLLNSKVDIASKTGISKEFYQTIEDDLIAI